MARARHMFPGGNTPKGFFSYFDQVLPVEQAQKIIYLKGTSGSGKSTFIKKVGTTFEALGDTVEYMHCSNDPRSLDGVCVRNKGICILDGTAPHVCDPKIPLAFDEIINLAEYIDESEVSVHREELKSMQSVKKTLINMAYGYYAAAYAVYNNNISIYEAALNKPKINKVTDDILEMLRIMKNGNDEGKNRRLFASAVSPSGKENFLDSIINTSEVYEFSGSSGMEEVLKSIQRYVNMRGCNTESFYCPLNPEKLEHLVIPALDISFVTTNKHHAVNLKVDKTIDFDEFLDTKKINVFADEINYNDEIFDELLQLTMDTLQKSKKVHEGIERIYYKNMDIKGLDALCEKTIMRLKEFKSIE